jgi:hypothetical protein
MLLLVIKGSTHDARMGASANGVRTLHPVSVTSSGETILRARDSERDKVLRWFHEDAAIIPGQGYAPGTLLHWAPVSAPAAPMTPETRIRSRRAA